MKISQDQWIDVAVMELGRRMPHLSPEEATAIARDHLWVEASDMDPAEAAEIYSLEAPPSDPGAPGDS